MWNRRRTPIRNFNMLGPLLISQLSDAVAAAQTVIEEEEPTISVFFWSVTFVLLLIVTVWFYITQIAPAHLSPVRRESQAEDKEELVAKRILELEQLHVIDGTSESVPCEKQVECGASGGGDFDTVYEYVDDEIHIHYPKSAWENDGEQINNLGSTRRRRSMDEMELIFPGILPRIVEEEEEEEGEEEEYSGDSEEQDLIDSFHKQPSEAARAHFGEARLFTVNRAPFEPPAKKTAVVKPGSHEVTTKSGAKEEISTVQNMKPRVAKVDHEYIPIKVVEKKWRLEPVKSQGNEADLLCSQDNSPAGASEMALEEHIKPAAHARMVEADPPPATHACPRAPDVEVTTSALRNAIAPQGSKKAESDANDIPVFTQENLELLPENKQALDEFSRNSDPVAKTENGIQCNGLHADEYYSKTNISEDEEELKSVKRSGNKLERQETEDRDRSEGEPVNTVEGLTRNATGSKYESEMNGTTSGKDEEPKVDRSPTTHTWTFFSMSGTSQLSSLELEHLGETAEDGRSLFKEDVPAIIIDSYDDQRNEDNGKNEPLPATEPKDHSFYTSSFETDIDVDEIDLTENEFDLEEESDFSLYFKRHVSVTDLDKILSAENATDPKDPTAEGDDIIVTNGSITDDIANELNQGNGAILETEHNIAIKPELSHKSVEVSQDPISTVSCDPGEDSAISEPEQTHENISCVEADATESTFAIETQESEPASSVTVYRLDQLLEQNQIPEDLDDDNLETFCEELSDLIDECKKERRPRLFTIPEEVEIADGVFVDRSHNKNINVYKAPVVTEPKSDSAPIATEETSDSEFDLEESDGMATDSPDENVRPVESSVVENLLCTEDVITEHEDRTSPICQTVPLESTDNTILDYTETRQEEQVKQADIDEDASSVNKPDGKDSFETETVEVPADALCKRNETHSAVTDDYVLDGVLTHPAYKSVKAEDEEVKNATADVFIEETSQVSEVPGTSPTMTVMDTTRVDLRYELAERDEEKMTKEKICRFQEEEVKATDIELARSIEVTSKRERGFRITRVKFIKERVNTDIRVNTEAAASPWAVPAKPVAATPLVPAQAATVTKVTVKQLRDPVEQAQESQSETKTKHEESPVEKLGLKFIVTGRRTDTQDEMEKEPSQVLQCEDIPTEGRVSLDSRRSSPRRSPLTTVERPRRSFKSTHQIRLSKSHDDLRFAGSYARYEPQRVVVKERLVPEEAPCVQSTLSVPSPPPAIPEDAAIESVQSPRIHKTKITVSETVGNRTRITILNVRKKASGNARWKSLNDLDSFGSPLPMTSEASRMSWSGDESSLKAEMAGGRHDKQRAGRVESGYGSLDFERETPSPPTDVMRSPDYTPRTQPKETIFAVSAEPVVRRRIASIEEETEDSSTDLGDEVLGESRVRVTDLDSALLSARGLNPKAEEAGPRGTPTQKASEDQVEKTVIKVRGYEGGSRHLVAYSVPEEAVPLEAVVLPQSSDVQENVPVVTAVPVNDGYEDEELDDVFYEHLAPTRNSAVAITPNFSNNVPDIHSSDADSETSSVHSVPLKKRHRHTRAALEASSARVPRLSDSTDSSHTATPIAELENDPFESFFQRCTANGKPTFGDSGDVTPRGCQSRSTTEINEESSEVTVSALSPVGSSRTSRDTSRTRPRSEFVEKAASDEDANKGLKTSFTSFKADVYTGREYEAQLFRDNADSRKSMPDLSIKSDAVTDSPYLRGLSAHTKRWLSQNFMSPATFSDEDDLLGSEMFLHPTSFLNLADDGDDVSIASVSTRPHSPMSEFSFAGEVPFACKQRGPKTLVKCAYARCAREEVLFGREKTTYTSCPACFTYYCSRDCRRVHWSEHKKVCFFGRINSYVRSFVYHTQKRENLKFFLSKAATEGYNRNGRGCVMVTFASPQSARKFMTTGCSFFPSPPSYSSLAKLKAEGVISKHKEVVVQLMKDYDPAQEFVLNLAIIAGKMENLPPDPVPRRKVNTVLQCLKIPLSDKLVDSSLRGELDTSPETKVFYLPKCSRHQFVNEIEARRHYCRNISKELKQYGIKLKKDYPAVYDKLCKYVEKNLQFEPQSVLGSRAGRAVTCKIMPES